MSYSLSATVRNDIIVPAYIQQQTPEYYKKLADSCMDDKQYDYAIYNYKKAIDLSPENKNLLLNISRAYRGEKDYNSSIISLNNYIAAASSTCEVQTMKGETYLEEGDYNSALRSFQKALDSDPKDDNAKRGYLEAQNRILAQSEPEKAKKERYEQGIKTLNEAISMASKYLSKHYLRDLKDIKIMFDKTASMSGTANIAQYEHGKKRIVITDKYVYAAPEIVSAYIVHEFVHAKDKDAYTSVAEEQDAYRAATQFWILNSHGIKDSEMDYAADLYRQSPEALDKRVEEIYKLRDSGIAMTSPNHNGKYQSLSSFSLKHTSANTSLKTYDYIA